MQALGISVLFKGINFQRLMGGLWVTLRLALITIGLSCLFGLLFGLLMLSRRKIAKAFGWDLDGETSAVIVFTFWGTAEMGDLIRGALASIPRHQTESAAALGLTKGRIYLHVLIPQTLRRLLPQAINLSTRIIKTTALVKMINVTEVLKVGQQIIGQFYRQPDAAFWVYFVIFLLYFLVCWPFSLLARQLEKRWA